MVRPARTVSRVSTRVVTLDKVKRPGGTYWFELRHVATDAYGSWLSFLRGSAWRAPHDAGVVPIDALVLLAQDRPFITWWVNDPDDPRVEIDVCLPPTQTPSGWSFVDLELDPVRHEADGRVEIEDEDEFAASVDAGWMSDTDALLAREAAESMADVLRAGDEPWGEVGWTLLHSLR